MSCARIHVTDTPATNRKHLRIRYQRQNGQPVCSYVGSGKTAELAATANALVRVQREKDDRKWQQQQENLAAVEALLKGLREGSDLLVRATLIVAGYHQHDRGEWRLKRVQQYSD